MKINVQLSPEQKEIVDGVSSLVELGRQAVKGGSKTIRQAQKTARSVSGVLDLATGLAAGLARAGRETASRIRTTSGEEDDQEPGGSTLVIDLRRRNGRRSQGDDQ